MWSDIDTTFTVVLERKYLIRILNVGGIFQDRFRVFVDGAEILSKQISYGKGSHTFTLGGIDFRICWKMSWISGQLTSIVLMRSDEVLAQYGNSSAVNLPSKRSTQNRSSSMHKLLKAAKEHGGQLSIPQAIISTELQPEEVMKLLHEAEKFGYAEIFNEPETGAVRYRFDV